MTDAWWQVRRWLVAACLVAVPLVVARAVEVANDIRRDRLAAVAYARGAQLQVEGRYDEAAVAFREVIAISPRATAAYASLGDVEFRRGRYDAAIDSYRQLMARYPYTYLPDLYREVGLIELRAGRPDDAARSLGEAVQLDSGDWFALYLLGHAYDRLGRPDEARAMWERVVALNPGFAPARDQLRRLNGQSP